MKTRTKNYVDIPVRSGNSYVVARIDKEDELKVNNNTYLWYLRKGTVERTFSKGVQQTLGQLIFNIIPGGTTSIVYRRNRELQKKNIYDYRKSNLILRDRSKNENQSDEQPKNNKQNPGKIPYWLLNIVDVLCQLVAFDMGNTSPMYEKIKKIREEIINS